MDPERARPCLTHTRSAPSTKKQILYANVETSLQQQPFNETTDKPVEQREKVVDNVESKNRKKSGAVDEKGEEDDLMITDDALSLPTTLQQSFAISSLSSGSKTDSKVENVSTSPH
ncbi:unnamed protein product [Anisakis simplex]|uniref:Uncharacterized protein n=1 Tax=Anisakis simplex TaxID=6269 RepID=A0A0M3JDK7_ANISI|nr:unnamed protein product [Anisakis simplex]